MKKDKIKQRNAQKIEQAQTVFSEFFNEYYNTHHNVKNIEYNPMNDGGGYYVILEYENFSQYVNYYANSALSDEPALVNTCFEFVYKNNRFLCHFVDILNAVDSDDLSFYTYPKCAKDDDIKNAAENIMSATEKYMDDLNHISSSDELKRKIYCKYIDEDDEYDEDLDSIEEMWDEDYFLYETSSTLDELRKILNRNHKKGKLEEGFETRAYRVLSGLDRSEIKQRQKNIEKHHNYSKKDRILMYSPYVIAAIVFAIAFGFIGYYVDKNMFSQYIGKEHWETAFAFRLAGALTSVLFMGFIEKPIYKLIVRKDYYDEFMQVVRAATAPKWLEAVAYALIVVIDVFLICIFCFNGIFFTQNGEIAKKDYAFSQVETYNFEDTDIATIEGSYDSNGYNEYIDTAYAFRLDGEWFEYGVPNDDAKSIIENSIKKYNKNVIKAEAFEDLE